MARVSEPRLVVLRERLEAERADGAPFAEAWPRVRTELLDGLGPWWRELWLPVLNATEDAWRRAYEGGRSSRVDAAVTELQAYAADGELRPLRYEPAAEPCAAARHRLRAVIATARLRLRALTLDDVGALHAIHSRDDIVRWLYWDVQDEDEVHASIEAYIAIPPESGVVLAIERDGELIGRANLAIGEHRQGELGYIVHPDHQGQGYATEAAEAMLELAFETYDLHRVAASVEPRNMASVRVLERLGMRKEAHLIKNGWAKGEWSSEAIYAILAREWREARGAR